MMRTALASAVFEDEFNGAISVFKPKTVFITGGAVGIGNGLAEAFLQRGSKVIVGGRREAPLRAFAESRANADWITIDVANPQSVAETARTLCERHPDLDCLINNAGVQRTIDFSRAQPAVAELRAEIDINLVGLIQTTSAFLPSLMRQGAASVLHVSSGLAFVPSVSRPLYCATKAAVHSFSQSLRHQLQATGVRVIEIAPPLVVDTELHEGQHELSPEVKARGMKVSQFVEETIAALDRGEDEIAIGLAASLRQQSRENPNGALVR